MTANAEVIGFASYMKAAKSDSAPTLGGSLSAIGGSVSRLLLPNSCCSTLWLHVPQCFLSGRSISRGHSCSVDPAHSKTSL